MDENLMDFIFQVSVIFLFVAAISIFMMLNNNASLTLEIVKEGVNQERSISEGNYDNEGYYVSGAEIINSIHNGLEVNIVVNGFEINKDNYSTSYEEEIDFRSNSNDKADVYSKIDANTKYNVTYSFKENGEIDKIIYTKY
ncbi:MAG: hypothetical protein ACOYWZ_14650 [Bacillota bacterium]